ncbi:ABC transporter ATP-binding protein [Natronosporangium hydrolyticum]|uniref:ABC transporter ATP-binding protein n=2 Tax=Natronosporangium hydrolyticum TaxID=2811111 RepID=A0A895YI49_9ACTN|nr:ABC transporter ATP-binding protein [Natronosporangium hydrolyticum]
MGSEAVVRLTGVSKRFGRVEAVAGIDLAVSQGERVAILGPNGAGKSTAISILLGLTRPDSGAAALYGVPASETVRAGRVGAMLQGVQLPWYATVGELIALARSVYPRSLPASELLRTAGLDRLTRRRIEKLSGGEAQRVKFAFALAGDPDLLVLDEPTAGLDVSARVSFWDTVGRLAAAGRTVIFATHYLAEAEDFADRVVVIARGRVVADGTSSEIRRAAATERRVSFRLDGASAAGLDRLPGVRTVAVRAGRAVLTCDDADAAVSALVQARGQVTDLEVTVGGLTEAYLALAHPAEAADEEREP